MEVNDYEYVCKVEKSNRNGAIIAIVGAVVSVLILWACWSSIWDCGANTPLYQVYDEAFIEVAQGARAKAPGVKLEVTGVARLFDNAYYHIKLTGRGEEKTAWVIFAKSDSPRQRYTITTW